MTKRSNKAPKAGETRIVVCHNGEEFVAHADTLAGIEFDGGTIPWSEVYGVRVWSKSERCWMFVPQA